MKRNTKENLIGLAATAVVIGIVILSDHSGLARKWHTAIFGTVGPFAVVIACYPDRWKRKSFWEVFAVCLLAHSVAITFLFEYVFAASAPGWLLWTPIAFVESIGLAVLVGQMERKIRTAHRGRLEM